jgi:branched-chain amino acid transport system permease protein
VKALLAAAPLTAAVVAATVLATLGIPLVIDDSGRTVYVFIGLATMVVAGISLLMGFAGQVSLGQAAFYAIGAYAAALLAKRGVPSPVALAAAPIAAAGIAAVMGIPLLRLRGHYLAFATLAFQLIVLTVLTEAKSITGGEIGLSAIPDLAGGPLAGDSDQHNLTYCYLAWVAVALVLLLTRNLVASRPGRALRALATSEVAAAASGVAVGRYKLQVFALSAGYAGLAGGIYAVFLSYVAPSSFPVLLSVQFLVMAAVGGLGAVWGSLVGAAAITLLVNKLKDLGTLPGMGPHAPAIFSYAVFGALLISVVLFLPQGVLPALRSRLAGRRAVRPGAGEGTLGSIAAAAELEADAAGQPRELGATPRSSP